MTEEELENLKTRIKRTASAFEWKGRRSNRAFFDAIVPLADKDGVGLAGIFFRIVYRHGATASDCNFNFQIARIQLGNYERLISLDVYQRERASHYDNRIGQVFGPHYRIGTKTFIDGLPDLTCLDFDQWLQWFCGFAGIILDHPCQSLDLLELTPNE